MKKITRYQIEDRQVLHTLHRCPIRKSNSWIRNDIYIIIYREIFGLKLLQESANGAASTSVYRTGDMHHSENSSCNISYSSLLSRRCLCNSKIVLSDTVV